MRGGLRIMCGLILSTGIGCVKNKLTKTARGTPRFAAEGGDASGGAVFQPAGRRGAGTGGRDCSAVPDPFPLHHRDHYICTFSKPEPHKFTISNASIVAPLILYFILWYERYRAHRRGGEHGSSGGVEDNGPDFGDGHFRASRGGVLYV